MAQTPATGSLQQKVALTLLAVMATLATLSYAILTAVIAPAFDDLESQAARTNLIRAERAVGAELLNLSHLAIDWAPWDDSYEYVLGENPGFEKSNLALPTLVDLRLNVMLFYNQSGELHWGRLLVDGQLQPLENSGSFGTGSTVEAELLNHPDVTSMKRGLLDTEVGPMFITSHPILSTDSRGPIAGTLILGRLMSDDLQAQLRERTEVDFSWYPVSDHEPLHGQSVSPILDNDPGAIDLTVAERHIDAHSVLVDIHGEPLLVLHAKTPRSISALGGRTLNLALLLLGVASLVAAIVIWLQLRHSLVRPLQALTKHITGMHESGDLSKQVSMQRNDEIGLLADKFDEMTGELDDARKLLLDQSFKAGKADNAAEVMHNIRNAMTPVINGIDRLGMVCSVTKGLKVEQATEQLTDPACDEDRRGKLIQYVESAFQHIVASHAEGEKELQAVSKQARQVEAILKDQEKHAHVAPITETLELDEMFDEAVLVIPKRKSPQVAVSVEESLANFRVQAHRVGLLQVLGNLVLNAYESIQRSTQDTGSITLSACRESIDDTEMVRVVVSDTGCGFNEDKKQKIFQRGFSSKDGNMSGLGLHWCANALAGMGGRIQAESTGDGQGAEFHILLPAAHGG